MRVNINTLERTEDISQLILSCSGVTLNDKATGMLRFCQDMSVETWTGTIDGELVCCWGLIPPTALSNQAYLWMHSTPAIRNHAFLIVRHSQLVIEKLLELYPRIVGECLVGARDSIRWLKWLGATFDESNGATIPFVIRKKSNG